ncbi:PDDEXK nuclease domain-containing protein [Petrimonas sp.]|uniref:PDDEXK nuclease domain-containing protein n=1 Tax=Petrimonas sp. TaxID=2023866 RepID=UPI003F518DDB
MSTETIRQQFIQDIKTIVKVARGNVYRAINTTMVAAYWNIGQRIVEEEQDGKHRAEYGKYILRELADALNQEFGKGFDERELRRMRQFYLTFPIRDSLRPELTWTHYRTLIRVENNQAREYYLNEAANNQWSVRVLDRNISTLYYDRLLISADKTPVIQEAREKTSDTFEFIKNPYVLEFLNLPQKATYIEKELEQALLDNLQSFLLELGKGFAFVSRQEHIRTETSEFYIDLIFYNYILKCFVLIELKTNKMSHQDIGQMDMYVRMFDDLKRNETDNPTIGILLCTETDSTIAKYSVLNDSKQLFASKYKLYLPSEDELRAEIEREKAFFQAAKNNS